MDLTAFVVVTLQYHTEFWTVLWMKQCSSGSIQANECRKTFKVEVTKKNEYDS